MTEYTPVNANAMGTQYQNEYFEDDVVIRKTEELDYNVGLITQRGWDESSDEENEDEMDEDEMEEKLKKDEVEIFWIHNDTGKSKVSELNVLDRSFLAGDIVARKDNQSGQTGTVTKVHMWVDLSTYDDEDNQKRLYNVPSNRIAQMYPINPESYAVSLDHKWFGVVVDTFVDVKVQFGNGSIATFLSADPTALIPEESSRFGKEEEDDMEDEEEDDDLESDYNIYYYPNQRVEVRPSLFEDETLFRWDNHIEEDPEEFGFRVGKVLEVNMSKLDMDWLHTLKGNPEDPPLSECKPNNIALVNHFSYSRWEVGEQCFVLKSEMGEKYFPKVYQQRRDNLDEYPGECLPPGPLSDGRTAATVTLTKTYVDIQWQDATVSTLVKATDLVPASNFLAEDFWPEDPVVPRIQPISQHKVGVVKKVNDRERTCLVRWIGDPLHLKVEASAEETEEEVPVMELKNYENWSWRVGEIVMLFPKEGQDNKIAGEIIKLENGRVQVLWNDKTITTAVPDELFLVDVEDESEGYEEDDMDEDYYSEGEEEDEGIYVEGNGVVQPAFLGHQSNAWWHENEMDSNNYQLFSAMDMPVSGEAAHPQNGESEDEEEEEVNKEMEEAEKIAESAIERDQSDSFTVLEELEESKFPEGNEAPGNNFVARVLKEWELLKRNLPEGIFIRTFENRMDVMQFLLIGPRGTPYEDVPFFFELQFPPEYPSCPPSVFFKSYGERVNPNLYVDGTVCLSLLGTWSGKGNENWNADTSNALQVVLSIHGLILGSSEPYFLEAGYDKLRGTPSGERYSRGYNESAFVFTLESIPRMLASPPKHFQDLIRAHFQKVGDKIISRCEGYLSKAEETENSKSEVAMEELESVVDPSISALLKKQTEDQSWKDIISGPSKGFCSSLERIVPVLKSEFEKLK